MLTSTKSDIAKDSDEARVQGHCVFVLGMHRSGTSMVSAMLEKLGFFCGEVEQLIPPAPDNPNGFWERKDVKDVNDTLLKANNFTWSGLSGFNGHKLSKSSIRSFEEGARLIIEDLNEYTNWFIKDPRLCLTFKYWSHLVNDPIVVFVYRDPEDIADSLLIRNGFSRVFSISLWEKYVTEAFQHIGNTRVVFFDYLDLLDHPEVFFQELHKHCPDLPLLEARILESISEYPDSKLNHATRKTGSENLLDGFQGKLKDSLQKKSQKKICQVLEEGSLVTRGEEILRIFEKAEVLERKLGMAEKRLNDKEREVDEFTNRLDKFNGTIEALEEKLEESSRKLTLGGEQYSALVTSNNIMIDKLKDRVFELETELHAKNDAFASLKKEYLRHEKEWEIELDEVRSEMETRIKLANGKTELAQNQLRAEIAKGKAFLQRQSEVYQGQKTYLDKKLWVLKKMVDAVIEERKEFIESWRWKVGHRTISMLEFALGRDVPNLSIFQMDGDLQRILNYLQDVTGGHSPFSPDVFPSLLVNKEKDGLSGLMMDEGWYKKLRRSSSRGLDVPLGIFDTQFQFSGKNKVGKCLVVNVITPSTNIHGGTKRLLTLAQLLMKRGHHVNLIRQYKSRALDWFDLDVPVLDVYFNENTPVAELEKLLPDSDILITYGNNKANISINDLSVDKGLKYCLFMHFGVHDRNLDNENAKLSSLKPLATTDWVARMVSNSRMLNPVQTIGFGVYPDQFYPVYSKRLFSIGTLFHESEWKRSKLVIDAWRKLRLKKGYEKLSLIMFGQKMDVHFEDEGIYYFCDPPQDQLRRLYSSCSVWVNASEAEGIGMCSVEAMLCKTPLITMDTGGSQDFCTERNCIIVEQGSIDAIIRGVVTIFDDPKHSADMAENAYNDINQHSWSSSIDRLEDVIRNDINTLNSNSI